MKNKLVVIINSLKVPKIKKKLLNEMKFLLPIYSCLQNPWLGGYRPSDPRSLCPLSATEFVGTPPPHANKIPGYATGIVHLAKDAVSFVPLFTAGSMCVCLWDRAECVVLTKLKPSQTSSAEIIQLYFHVIWVTSEIEDGKTRDEMRLLGALDTRNACRATHRKRHKCERNC